MQIGLNVIAQLNTGPDARKTTYGGKQQTPQPQYVAMIQQTAQITAQQPPNRQTYVNKCFCTHNKCNLALSMNDL